MTQSGPKIISGEVRSAAGGAVPDARIFIADGPVPFSDIAILSDSQGRFSLSVPAEGAYTVACVAEGFAPVSAKVEVPMEKTLHIDLKSQS